MKKFSKLLALLLTVCLISGIAVIGASAISSTEELEAHYTDQLKPSGVNNYFAYTNHSSWGIASSIGTNGIAEKITEDGNTYTGIHYKYGSDTFPSTIGGYYALKTGSTSFVLKDYGLTFNGSIQQNAIVFDMDIAPERYTVTSEVDGVTTYKTYTHAELLAAGLSPDDEGVDISYYDKDSFYLSFRYCTIELATNTTPVASSDLKSAGAHVYYVKDTDGTWYYANNKQLSSADYKVKVSGVGTFDHVTAIAYPKLVNSGETVYTELCGAIFINGEVVFNGKIINSDKTARSVWMDEFRMNVSIDAKNNLDSYAYAVDNYAINYYGADYASAGYGIDDLISDGKFEDGSIFKCTDAVGSKDYISPNGFVQVKKASGNRDFVSMPSLVEDELALLENGDTLYTTMNLKDFNMPDNVTSLFIECDNTKVSVTPSDELLRKGFAVKKTSGGYTAELGDDYATLKIYDATGNLISEKTLGFGFAPDLADIKPSSVADGVIKYTDSPEWQWSLDGEIGAIDETMISSGGVITVTPKDSCLTVVEGATFAMGNYDENYRFIPAPASDGTYTFYKDAVGDSVITEIIKSTNGNVCILLADFTGISGDAAAVGATTAQNLAAGKSFFMDLNGHKLIKFGQRDIDQIPFFTLQEGTELSVYSSRAGGELLVGSARANVAAQLNQIRSGGICYFKSGIESATLNVGALLDEDGKTIFDGDNFSFTGGSIVIALGAQTTDDLSGGKKKYINIIGGSYFIPFRGSYSFVTLQGPDTVITFDGIELYGTYSSTSLVHEYDGFSTHGTDVTVRNSEVYGTYLFYRAAYGNYYISNSTVAVKTSIVQNIVSTVNIVVGTGNRFACSASDKLFTSKYVTFENGVTILYPNADNALSGKINKDFTHAAATLSWTDNVDITFKEGAVINGAVDTLDEAAYIESMKLKDSVITNKTTTSLSYDCYAITVSADNIPSGVSAIDWQDESGKSLAVTYHFVGESAEAPEECAPYELAHDWHVERYSWKDVVSVTEGKTIVKPTAETVAKIFGILQNATLFSDMTYNLYLPVSDEVTDVSVTGATLAGTTEIDGVEYYIVSASPKINEFEPIQATVSFKLGGEELEYGVKLDVVKYASAVANYYVCGSEEAILVYEILSFKSAVAKYVDSEFAPTDALSDFMTAHASCNCGDTAADISAAEKTVNYDAIKAKGVSAISYTLSLSEIGMVIYVNDGTEIASVSYSDPLGRIATHTVADGNLEKRDGYYIVTGVSAAYIDNIMTISVSDGTTGTYSLGKYIENSTDESVKAVATALYTYASAADSYKTITTTEHKFTVSFDTDGGEAMSAIKVKGGETVPTPDVPKKFAYSFVEWQLNGETYDFTTPLTEDITLTAVWERAEDTEVYDKMQSVLLIGQSNMVGIGLMSTVDPIEDDRLFMMSHSESEWVKMQEPLHGHINSRSGVSLGASFGKAFVDTFGCDVGLIPAAMGSTTLADWAVGGDLYTEAVRLAKIAQETSDIAAILWHQGEGNQNTTDYAAQLRVILDSMLAELGLDPNKIVIITGELFGTRSDAVHMGQLIELGQYYKNYGIALSDGLTVLDVTTHFDGPSLRVFGYRYFAIFYNLITGKTFEYDDNPENYWSSQISSSEYVYLPFDDMLTGNACTGYAGSGYITVSGTKGVAQILKGDDTDRYLSANNYVGDTVYDSIYVDSKNNAKDLAYGGVVVSEVKIRLGAGHNRAANILAVHTENSAAVYSNFYLDASGNLAVVDADGNKTNKITLNTSDWVYIKVILDTEKNLKDIYINDEIVLRGVAISNDVNPADLVIDSTRLVGFESDSADSIGSVQFDDYRFYPYFDNLQPGE